MWCAEGCIGSQNRAHFEKGGPQCIQRCGFSERNITYFFSRPEKLPNIKPFYNQSSVVSLFSHCLQFTACDYEPSHCKEVFAFEEVLWLEFLKTFFWKKNIEVSPCVCFNVTKQDICKQQFICKKWGWESAQTIRVAMAASCSCPADVRRDASWICIRVWAEAHRQCWSLKTPPPCVVSLLLRLSSQGLHSHTLSTPRAE